MANIIRYEPKNFELLAIFTHEGKINPKKPTSYVGDPRPELEDAWDKLMAREFKNTACKIL